MLELIIVHFGAGHRQRNFCRSAQPQARRPPDDGTGPSSEELVFQETSMHAIPTRAWLGALLALTLVAFPGFRGSLAAPKKAAQGGVLAVVDGKPITEEDVERSAAADFEALERDYAQKHYDLVEANLNQLVEQR